MARYKKLDGFSTTEGQSLEAKLCALLYLRAVNSGLDFQLASNVAGAGALDDIVFRFRRPDTATWTSVFVQTKHKKDAKLMPAMFTANKGNFSMPKYFKSFKDIQARESSEAPGAKVDLLSGAIADKVFVIFTNAPPNKFMGQGRSEVKGNVEEFLSTSADGKIYEFDPDAEDAESLDKKVFDSLDKKVFDSLDKKVFDSLKGDADDKIRFMRQTKLFCSQAGAGAFDALILDELAKLKRQEVSAAIFVTSFMACVTNWWEKPGTAAILDQDSDLLELAKKRALVQTQSLQQREHYRLEIEFQELGLLKTTLAASDWSALHVASSEASALLTCAKVLQAGAGANLFTTIGHLAQNHASILPVWREGSAKTLIVLMSEQAEAQGSQGYADVAKEMSAILSAAECNHRAVVLSRASNSLTEALAASLGGRFKRVTDTFEFSQISESETRRLDAKFKFQGFPASLEKFLGPDCDQETQALHWACLVDVIRCDTEVSVGPALANDIKYFIPRTLERVKIRPIVLDTSFFAHVVTVVHSALQNVQRILEKCDSSISHDVFYDTLKKNSKLKPKLNENNQNVIEESKFKLGLFEACNVGLRVGQEDEVTALRIRLQENSSRGWILFVSEVVSDEDVTTLSRFNQSEHFFRLSGERLLWKKSVGDSMELIRRHVDEAQVTELRPDSVADVEERVVLVCNEPGMGKTILMNHLALQTKLAFPNVWVIKIALNDHTKLFQDDIHLDPVKFLLAATNTTSSFQQSLFTSALATSGNVIIMMDGFDEISPTYGDKCCCLMSSLLKTGARKIWIASRNTMKQKLEDHLRVIALKLRKFNEGDQRNFFLKYWKQPAPITAELDEFITSLLKMTHEAFSDREKEFMGVPLQTQMMAEVHEDYVTGKTKMSLKKLDLLQLLELFIDKKLHIFANSKQLMNPSGTDYEDHVRSLKEKTIVNHMQAGLIAILSDQDLRLLHATPFNKDSEDFFERIRSGRDKTGIIDSMVNDKPRFVHRVFAEYFTAMWFARHFAANALFLKNNLFTANLTVVRDIFDRILCRDKPVQTAVLNNDVGKVRELLDTEGSDVNATDAGGRTALHLAVTFGIPEEPEEVTRCREMLDLLVNKTTDFEQKERIFNLSSLELADLKKSWIAIDKLLACKAHYKNLGYLRKNIRDENLLNNIFNYDLDALMGFYLHFQSPIFIYFRDFQDLLPSACKQGSLRVATLLVKKGASIDWKSFEKKTLLHIACEHGHLDIAEWLLSTWRSNKSRFCIIFTTWVRNKLLCCNRRSAATDLIDRRDRGNKTALYRANEHGHLDVVRFLIGQDADRAGTLLDDVSRVLRSDEAESTAS